MKESNKTTALLSADELANLLVDANVKIFDVRGHWATPPVASVDEYLAGHVPGAVFLDWTKEFLEPDVPTNLASVSGREDAASSFARLGINADDHVIVYDDNHHMLSARVWWALRFWGIEAPLFDASIAVWKQDPTRAMVRG